MIFHYLIYLFSILIQLTEYSNYSTKLFKSFSNFKPDALYNKLIQNSECQFQNPQQLNMEYEENLLDGPEQQTTNANKTLPLIYSWGRNEEGQLAQRQNTQSSSLPFPPKGMKGICKQIVSARSHTALLNTEGQIFVCGSLLFGRLGINTKTAKVNNYRDFKLLTDKNLNSQKIIKLACGDFHTLALSQNGLIYSWGGTLWDKTGHKNQGIVEITKLKGKRIVDIACGDFHSVALDSEGRVYSWGGGGSSKNKGQLGHGNMKDISQPQEIKFFKDKRVTKIACGDYHTMIMTSDDEIYAFGEGTLGQLGTGGKQDCPHPKKVVINLSMGMDEYFDSGFEDRNTIEQIALGAKHSLFLTSKGRLYVCGYGSQGQLGLGKSFTSNCYEPTLVKSLVGKQIIMIAAGSNHSLALTSRFDVYSCGHNAKGQLGIGESKSCTVWTHISTLAHKKVARIYAGGQHSWAVIDQTQPITQNYRPPSPIKLNIDEPTMIRQNESYSRQEKNSFSANSVDQILVELNSNRKLELILTQTSMSHRFIHFILKDNVRNYKKKIEQYIKYVYDAQKEIKFHKFTQDGDVTDQNGQIKVAANPKGCTIMFVAPFNEQCREYDNCNVVRNKIPIGEMMMLNSNILKVDGKIPVHNIWFFKFCDMFDEVIDRVRFIELRPKDK